MTYELAKQLKEAGFPQTRLDIVLGEITLMNPTLEELIEACGDLLQSLNREASMEPVRWYAWNGDRHTPFGGSTPTEAVAKLWLALNLNKK